MEKNNNTILNLSLPVKLIQYIVPSITDPANELSFPTFLKWRTSFRQDIPTENEMVDIDEIPTELLAGLYGELLSKPSSVGMASILKTHIASKRKENEDLDRLCTEYENRTYDLEERLQQGRLLLLGK